LDPEQTHNIAVVALTDADQLEYGQLHILNIVKKGNCIEHLRSRFKQKKDVHGMMMMLMIMLNPTNYLSAAVFNNIGNKYIPNNILNNHCCL